MRQKLITQPAIETPAEQLAGLDFNTQTFIHRRQLKREAQSIASQIKAIDEDVRTMMLDGETFSDGEDELYILSVETTTADWKAMLTAGLLTPDQLQPYLKRTVAPQIRSRKCEKTIDPNTEEGKALRKRIEQAGKGILNG